MKKNIRSIVTIFFTLTFIAMLIMPATCLAGDMKIEGKISDYGTIITDSGDEYNLAENEKSTEMMDNVGKKVTVVGNVVENADGKTITVTSYKIMGEEE